LLGHREVIHFDDFVGYGKLEKRREIPSERSDLYDVDAGGRAAGEHEAIARPLLTDHKAENDHQAVRPAF